MKALLVLLVAATLAGCASLSQHQCLQGDWYSIGVGDGQLGMPADRLDQHTRACAQYGVTIDTSMTTADSSYYPGTADSVARLTEYGGQAALNAAVCGNVDATFACLAALDNADVVSAYARFNCTVRYNAAGDEYIVVVLYG